MEAKMSSGLTEARVLAMLEANAKSREMMLSLLAAARLEERGISTRGGYALELMRPCDLNRAKHRDHKFAAWWLGAGRPYRLALAVTPKDGERIDLDPPLVLDDPATLSKPEFRE